MLSTLTVPFEQHLYDLFVERITESSNQKAKDFVATFDVTTMGIMCNHCNEVKPVYCFSQDYRCKKGMGLSRCIECMISARCPWRKMYYSMLGRTIQRNNKGKNHGDVEYTPEDLKEMFFSQNRKCAISGNLMVEEYATGNPFAVSPERLDNNKGYVKGNVVLICQYLQISSGNYTIAEIKSWFQYDRNKDSFVFDETIFNKPISNPRKRRQVIFDGDRKMCTECGVMKPLSSYTRKGKRLCTHCKHCHNEKIKQYRSSPYGFVKKMAHNAKSSSKKRSLKRRRNDQSGECADDLFTLFVDIIKKQGGRCAITGIPFQYEQNNKFAPSPDRLDDSNGYIEDNVKMIIVPLNTQNNLK